MTSPVATLPTKKVWKCFHKEDYISYNEEYVNLALNRSS